ncbi:sensor histidine kinase [Winogradskyella psychrotolerans]|uniref:sensor histidine kinase n=1 Tax=Winogradskyella psychrotolerans TaxID=1344585 RepID=UPI001C07DA01|nr:histidine kinase [Winogradskyella psychrotolerans]MBU2929798.1 histidine kinase [Winogradskyella psychrotolerans]
MIIVLIIICSLVILFFVFYQKRKNQLLLRNAEQQQRFDEELLKTQQEIQEETLKHVGRELHDNIGQMLVMSTMQMNAALTAVNNEAKTKVNNAAETLKNTLDEVRALSRSLNSDVIFNLGFEATLKNEVVRLNKSGLIDSTLSITGEKVNFENKKDEIILFRILQEFFSNTLKYAEAEHLRVSLEYKEDVLNIKAEDDGKGFDVSKAEKGSGLINMGKRAELLNAILLLESQIEKGTSLSLKYPYKTT